MAREKKLPKKIIFYTGNCFHELMDEFFPMSKEWEIVGIEMDMSDGLPENFVTRPDVIAVHKKTKLTTIFEFKTTRSRMFDLYRDGNISLPREPHLLQVEFGKYACRKKGMQIDLMVIIYFDKAGEHWPLWFEHSDDRYTDTEIETIFSNAEKNLMVYEKTGKYPDKMPMELKVDNETGKVSAKHSWMCTPGYCEYCNVSCDGYPDIFEKVKVVGNIKNNEFFVNKKYADHAELLAPSVYNYIDSMKSVIDLGGM